MVGYFQPNPTNEIQARQQSTVMELDTLVAIVLLIRFTLLFCGLLLSVAKRAIVIISLMSDGCVFYFLRTSFMCFRLRAMIFVPEVTSR
jgi:hypothetical protein